MECHAPWWADLLKTFVEPATTLIVLAINIWQSRQMKQMGDEYKKIKKAFAKSSSKGDID